MNETDPPEPLGSDHSRDLLQDLATCESALPAPWIYRDGRWDEADAPYWQIESEADGGYPVAGVDPSREKDARFITEARTGWPAAIRRCLAAETENTRLRLLLANAVERGLAACPYGMSDGPMAQCRAGFPGCACADDLMLGMHELTGSMPERLKRAESIIAACMAHVGTLARPDDLPGIFETLAQAARGCEIYHSTDAEAELSQSPIPCGDQSCVCELPPGGMRTNGGCRCGPRALRLEVMRQRQKVAALEQQVHASGGWVGRLERDA